MKRLLVLAVLVLVPVGARPTHATFVAASANPETTFTTAADFNTVAVTLDDPGTPRMGTIALSAAATSARGIGEVRFEHQLSGGPWTPICTDTTAPYGCDWNTSGHDGLRTIRATARDAAGYERASQIVARQIDNTAPSLGFTHATAVHGTVSLSVSAADAGVGVAPNGIRLEYSPAGTDAWVEICRRSSSGSCAWSTTGLANGAFDLRASAADALGNSATPVKLGSRQVDNSPPTTSVLAQPQPNQSGVLTMRVDAGDAGGSNVDRVVFQGRGAGGSDPWMDVCVDTAAPYECSGNTAGFNVPGYGFIAIPDGMYAMRALVYDGAGNQAETPTYTFRIDNTKPAIANFNPPLLTGTVPLSASVGDGGSGLDSVRIESSADNGSSWITLCASAACDWAVPAGDATWDLRVVAADRAGNQQIVNVADRPGGTQPAASAVSGVNGVMAGTLDAGDAFTLTYSEAIRPQSLVAGWDGAGSQPVTVTIAAGDLITFGVPALGQIQLGRDVTAGGATFAGTLSATGVQLTVTLGPLTSGAVIPAAGDPVLTWTPSAAATDATGLPATVTPVTGTESL